MPKPNTTQQSHSINVSLSNLSQLTTRMDSLQTFLSQSIQSHTLLTNHQMNILSNEILTAIRHLITNGTALLSAAVLPLSETPTTTPPTSESPTNSNVVELDAMELVANHLHFCEVCGKGFTRDANLRMHMRAHGDEFKTPQALAANKPRGDTRLKPTRFSCPFEGCNRNRTHNKFRALKSVLCLRNHFKRSHCPKTLSCERCRKKSFAVLSDLRSHVKQCRGEATWKCSCGTTFSRKDKLFGHVALFEGHSPMLVEEERDTTVAVAVAAKESHLDGLPEGFFDGLDEFGFGSIENN